MKATPKPVVHTGTCQYSQVEPGPDGRDIRQPYLLAFVVEVDADELAKWVRRVYHEGRRRSRCGPFRMVITACKKL